MEIDFEKVRESVWLREDQYLFDYIGEKLNFRNGLPEGIFNKKYPGMGATFCEFHADRPSILVFPFRRLAFEKFEDYKKKGRNTFFVGTDPNNQSTSKYQIKDWYSRNKSKNPKFSVVADSIEKLVEALHEVGCNPFKEFFLVLDEVELLQMQSGFRSKLPLCFDYFKKFKRKCLVSATLLDFSDEELKKLPQYDLEVFTHKTDELGIPYTRDKERLEIRTFKKHPHWGIANQLVDFFKSKNGQSKDNKFLIGLNSLEGLSEMIEIFEKAKIENLVSVHVSSNSKERFYKKYNKFEIKSGILPTPINLTSCINFSGIDIHENIHAVAITLKGKVHHAFSFENLVQFFGRSRTKEQKPPYTFALSLEGNINYQLPKVPLGKRKEDLNGLIDYVTTKIEEEKDRADLIKAISETKSSLIYINNEGKPAVNWLLEDLENHELDKVELYKKKGEILISKLNERYKIEYLDYTNSKYSILPDKRTDEEKEAETLDKFLDNLDADYESRNLVDRFLDDESKQSIKVAAYWYLFGRAFSLEEENCWGLASHYSRLKKPYQISSVVVDGLRLYTRYPAAFSELVKILTQKRTQKKYLSSSEIPKILENKAFIRQHFRSFFQVGNPTENASILMEHFFGLKKEGGDRPKFKFEEKDLEKPSIVEKILSLTDHLKDVSKTPKSKGLDFGKINLEHLIDTDFNNVQV
ncbi:hypothetical protein [Algoriphagus formosus]|uniref:hypothetical protein n=1 Tax=Algoriphagus formosus TaxID=2007308 RepID=UPI000C2863D7|nr:hypothetical protein [Algoriphagus formosus]